MSFNSVVRLYLSWESELLSSKIALKPCNINFKSDGKKQAPLMDTIDTKW